ncbi:hypothetical protein ACROYT_G013230 [Oculina patagonica]
MEGYLEEMGIKHRLTTPLWPRANGEVERQNRSLLKAMRVAHAEKRDWRIELNKFLLAYRSTPHVTAGKSPAELLYGRKMSTKLPEVADLEEPENLGYQQARDHDAEKKQIGADHVDKKHQAAEKCIQEGDLVLLEKRKENKLSPNYEKEPYQVTARYGDQVQLKSPQATRPSTSLGGLGEEEESTLKQISSACSQEALVKFNDFLDESLATRPSTFLGGLGEEEESTLKQISSACSQEALVKFYDFLDESLVNSCKKIGEGASGTIFFNNGASIQDVPSHSMAFQFVQDQLLKTTTVANLMKSSSGTFNVCGTIKWKGDAHVPSEKTNKQVRDATLTDSTGTIPM